MEQQETPGKELLRRAKILFASGDVEKSVEIFTLAEEKGCASSELWLSRGAAQMALGHFDAAQRDFTRVLDEDGRNERAHYFRGVALVALGRYEDGIADLTASLMHNNNRGIAHLVRGLAYGELGQQSDALLDINSASAFSDAELASFRKLFGKLPGPFQNSKAMLSEKNAPWNNLLSKESADKLQKLFL